MPKHLNFSSIIDSKAPFTSVVLDDRYAFFAGIVAADFPEGWSGAGLAFVSGAPQQRTATSPLTAAKTPKN